MTADLRRPWLIDSRDGSSLSYGELLGLLGARELTVRPLCRPSDTHGALLELTRALVAGSELTLFDPGFTAHEVEALGYSADLLAQSCFLPGREGLQLADLQELAGGASRLRLSLFTSGSTGLPKRVEHAMGSLSRAVRSGARHADDVWALAFNPTHVAGVQVYLQALANANTVVDVSATRPELILPALRRHEVTHISATPTFYRLLLSGDDVLPSVRSVALGGEVSDGWLHSRLRRLFPNARLHNIYASNEMGTLLETDSELFTIPAQLADRVQIKDGSLHVHRSLLGHFADRVATSEGEWYDTGDTVEVVTTDPMSFRFAGRARDWINVGGNKVNPHEVEAVLGEHPAVLTCRVYGRPNVVLGQLVCADVVPRGTAPTEPELRGFATQHLQPYKVPRMIRFVHRLESTRTGKISRL